MQRTLFFTLIGPPNAGKSTLTNKLVGQKVSIVTPKVQTTRARLTGICMEGETQIVLIDTPGIFKPSKPLDKAMVKSAWGGLREAGIAGLIIDARKGCTEEVEHIAKGMKQRGGRAVLLLNKVDKMPDKASLLALTAQLSELHAFEEVFMISALEGDGVNDLKRWMVAQAAEEPWPFPEDQAADMPVKLMAAEITREKLMLSLKHELPYELYVDTELWEEQPPSKKFPQGGVKAHQVIYVTQEKYKMIVVGKGGAMIRAIGEASRKELSQLLGLPVHLFLFVKVDENWQSKTESYRAMGLRD